MLKSLAIKFIERAEFLGYRGKKRDEMALEFFCGAATALYLAGNAELGAKAQLACSMMISIRGYGAVVELSKTEK